MRLASVPPNDQGHKFACGCVKRCLASDEAELDAGQFRFNQKGPDTHLGSNRPVHLKLALNLKVTGVWCLVILV